MSDHLSQDQFAKCAVGQSSRVELEHLNECPQCTAELDRFVNTLSLFQTAIRHRIDDRVARHPSPITPVRPAVTRIPKWSWAVVTTAFVVLVTFPLFLSEYEPKQAGQHASTEANPDEIMERVNRHLSRMVPAPMEPMMSLIPEELVGRSGGVQ
jgi:hypothetical protein